MSGGNKAPLITNPIPSQCWGNVVVVSVCGDAFQWQGQGVWFSLGKLNRGKYRDIFNENLLQGTQDIRLCWRVTFQQDNGTQHIANTTLDWLRDYRMSLSGPVTHLTSNQLDISRETWKCLWQRCSLMSMILSRRSPFMSGPPEPIRLFPGSRKTLNGTFKWLQVCIIEQFFNSMLQFQKQWKWSVVDVNWVAILCYFTVYIYIYEYASWERNKY